MDDIKTTAEYYRRGLLVGIHSVADAMMWINEVLITEPEPDVALIEASLSGREGATVVAEWLWQVPGEFDRIWLEISLLGAMYRWLLQDRTRTGNVAEWLYNLALENLDRDNHPHEVTPEMWHFYDDFLLAKDGVYGNEEDVRDELIKFLAQYNQDTK